MAELPIEAVLPQVRETLDRERRAVVQAPPGAGKSTVLPLALMDAPWLAGRRIIMLEPRRLAARAVAGWMAHRLGERVGQRVGYRMRLDKQVSNETLIEVVTEGVLTRMLQDDPALEHAGCIIFDEFHERSLNADLGLAFCLDAQTELRDDLRLLIMSATLDAEPIAQWLGGAPIIAAEGRSFTVGTHYLPRTAGSRLPNDVAAAIGRALNEQTGDLLVFLPGAGEIRRVQQLLDAERLGAGVVVLPLYGDLPQPEQERAIAPAARGERKVVLSTSIAETSLTIEGVRVVVDGGMSRRAQFDPRSGMTRLATLKVSRAAADQRRGRAGRLGPGVCYRLWSESATLTAFTPAEILEADLCPLALDLAAWGVTDPLQLRWLTPPPAAAFSQARDLLTALGALNGDGRITAHGRAIASLGTHPRLAHMLARAQTLGLENSASELAALLSERDVLKWQPGARHADLRLRVEALRGLRDHLPEHAHVDRAGRERVRKLAQSWRQRLPADAPDAKPQEQGNEPSHSGVSLSRLPSPASTVLGTGIKGEGEMDRIGILVALAYPDRVARRRGGQRGRYQLSNGRGAVLAEDDALAREEFLAIADLDAGEHEGRVYLAAPLSRAQMEEAFTGQLATVDHIAWDSRSQTITARTEQRLGKLVIGESALEQPAPERLVRATLDGIREVGIAALPWDEETRRWQARVSFLRGLDPLGWPDVSDQSLLDSITGWLAPFLPGVTRRDQFSRIDLRAALHALLTWPQQRELYEQAPTHLPVPSGSRIALDYSAEDGPVLAARLQELFGLSETPRIARGRVPITIHLLSPARRPVQVTRDLASFWAHGYHEVKKELKGRYPRHYWPDDPSGATATRRVRPR